MYKILIVKTSSLGDIVHTYPVIDYLRRKFPEAQIDWVVEAPFADLVLSHPYVNNALTIATKAWRKQRHKLETLRALCAFRKRLRRESYDVVFDLQGNTKSGLILSQVRSSRKIGFGKKTVSEWPNLLFTHDHVNPSGGKNIRCDYLALVASIFYEEVSLQNGSVHLNISNQEQAVVDALCSVVNRPLVAVCPGSAWQNKQMTPETLKAFLSLLSDYLKCYFIFVWGSSEERQIVEELHLEFKNQSTIADKMPLPMLQNLMNRCDLVLAMDSLPLHLAGTTKARTLSVFGASSAIKYKPLGTQHHAYQGTCPYGQSFVKRCPLLRTCKTGACIRNLRVEDVFEEFKSWWSGSN